MNSDDVMVLRKKNVEKNKVVEYNKAQGGNIGKKLIDPLTGEVYTKLNKNLDKEQINKLISLRATNKFDQKTLAAKLNLPYSEIKDAESGKEIKLKTYNSICKFINQ